MKRCKVRGCKRTYYAKDYCKLHYGHKKKYGRIYREPIYKRSDTGMCSVEGCGRRHHANGYCDRHSQQIQKHGEIYGQPGKTKFDRNDYEKIGDGYRIILCDNARNIKGITMIDAADLDSVLKKKWHLSTVGYAVSDDGKTQLSAFILGHKQNHRLVVDHINQDKLDNRRSNLRIVSRSVNAFNSKTRIDNTSGCPGVSWDTARGKWKAQICIDGKVKCIGRFTTIENAITARKSAEALFHAASLAH